MPVLGKVPARIRVLRRQRRELLGELVAFRDRGTPLDALCERAVASVDEYAKMLADSLSRATNSASEPGTDRLRSEYSRVLGEFAEAIRDIIPDREARHALAQAIQCAVLRHERRLREVSDVRVACQP